MIRRASIGAAALAVGLMVAYGPSLSDPQRPAVSAARAGNAASAATAARSGAAAILAAAPAAAPAKPLAGVRIALDPGHQLGNHNFGKQIRKPVPAGGFTKPCNTTGTATNSGYSEASLNFAIAVVVKKRLETLGAKVFLTRTSNSEKLWGPCVNKRGEFGKAVNAVLEVSLHGDGAKAGDRGFHVIAPTSRKPWTNDIAAASLRLAKALRSGLDGAKIKRSTYIGGGTALSVRSDLGTLNMSDVPIAMIEVGNMRNASDARRMTSAQGRATYAAAVVAGIRRFLAR